MTFASRLSRLEGRLGTDSTERLIRSLSDEELDAQIAELTAAAQRALVAHQVDCSEMSIDEVIARLEALENNQEKPC